MPLSLRIFKLFHLLKSVISVITQTLSQRSIIDRQRHSQNCFGRVEAQCKTAF